MDEMYENEVFETSSPKTDRYSEAFSKYVTDVDMNAIRKTVEWAKTESVKIHDTETLKKIMGCIDLTTLKPTDNEDTVLALVEKVNDFDNIYPDIPNVASVCVYPCYAGTVSRSLEADNVKTCCVSGGFPSSQTFIEVKIAETSLAIHEGAEEIDIVQNAGHILNGDYETLAEETDEIKEVCKNRTLKVILETGAIAKPEDRMKAALLAMYSGADFIKTSTGKEVPGADPESFCIMCQAIRAYATETGRKVGIKAAGGISTVGDALVYWCIVKKILGKDWLDREHFRIGASRLANALLSEISGKETNHF